MSNDIKNWAKKQTVGDRNAKCVFLELADVVNDDGFCWYSIPTIAATLEASPKTVERGFAYLVEKGFISREAREKTLGQFNSKLTRIIISETDRAEIAETRLNRRRFSTETGVSPTDKMTDGSTEPTDNLTDGEASPADNLTEILEIEEKPPVILSVGGENHPSFCPPPSLNLSNGQFDAQYIRDKELISEPLKESEERERERTREHTAVENFLETYQTFFDRPLKKIQRRIIGERIRDGTIWRKAVIYWASNDYRADSIGKLCDKYDELVAENQNAENVNGNNGNNENKFKSGQNGGGTNSAAPPDHQRTDAETLAWLGIED